MGNSLNIPAVKVEASTGVDRVVDMARRMGAPPWQNHGSDTKPNWVNDDPPQNFGYSLTLGGYGETPLQMATGASVLGAQGVYHEPFGIASVKASDGTDIFKADPAKTAKQVIDPKVAFIMEQIMSDDDNRAMIFGRNSPLVLTGRRAGAKTGTTDNFTDAWTVGYTPSLASAFWFGNANNAALTQGSDGIYVAAPAWHGFMQGALDALKASPAEWFSEPPGLGHALVNGKTVYLMPGTNAYQPAPPLPSNAHSSGAPAACPPAPSDQGGNNNGNNGQPTSCVQPR
jgi:penicillin-binding protein 1A